MVFVDVVCHLLYSEMIAIFFCSLLYYNNQFHLLHYYFFLMHHLHLREPFVGISLGMDRTSQQCFFFIVLVLCRYCIIWHHSFPEILYCFGKMRYVTVICLKNKEY